MSGESKEQQGGQGGWNSSSEWGVAGTGRRDQLASWGGFWIFSCPEGGKISVGNLEQKNSMIFWIFNEFSWLLC